MALNDRLGRLGVPGRTMHYHKKGAGSLTVTLHILWIRVFRGRSEYLASIQGLNLGAKAGSKEQPC